MHQSTMDQVNSIPHYGAAPSPAGAIYSTVLPEHLHGFRPVAYYGEFVDPARYDRDKRVRQLRRTQDAQVPHHVAWLLLEKNGDYFVDRLSGLDHRGYGVNPTPPRITEVLLPPECYDRFHAMSDPMVITAQ